MLNYGALLSTFTVGFIVGGVPWASADGGVNSVTTNSGCSTIVGQGGRPTTRLTPISLGVLLPDSYRRRIEPAIHLALAHVHATSALLPDYCLQLIYKDTKCKTALGMKSLFDLMSDDLNSAATSTSTGGDGERATDIPDASNGGGGGGAWTSSDDGDENTASTSTHKRPAALFGDVCTNVNEPIAMASKYWDILHLSYAETHSKFSTADAKDLYPTFFRIVPGDSNLIRARCRLVKNFNWTRVGTIKQSDDPYYALPHERLTTVLENQYNVRVIYTAGLSTDQISNIGAELDELKHRDAHIIIGDFSAALAVRILCEAYRRSMFGPNYLWILPGYHRFDWWRDPALAVFGGTEGCSAEQTTSVLQGHFALEFAPLRPYSSVKLVSNRTVAQVQRELRQLCGTFGMPSSASSTDRSAFGVAPPDTCQSDVFAGYAYDGIWTLALALNATLYADGGPDSVVASADALTAQRLLPAVQRTWFEGVTGRVRFENNERLGLVHLLQWMNGSYSKVGFYDSTEAAFHLHPLGGWSPPLDATVVIRQRQYVSYWLLLTMALLSMVGVLLAFFFFFINVKYRNHRFIKMSSPNMNNLIIVGSICAYGAVFLLGADTRFVSAAVFEKLCYAKTWILSLGFTLAFGSMFSKTWRVHSIFTNIRRDKKAIRDSQLYMIVAGILLVDVVILGLWAMISPFRFSITQLLTFRSDNVLIVPELEQCRSEFSVVFQVVFYIIKGMLMLFGCFLAWETRAVNVPALNDSKYIGMSVYLVVVMCVVGLSLAFVLQERINEAFALICFFIICCTSMTLLLVFMPKVVELIRTPHGADQHRYRRKRMMKSMVGGGSGRIGSVADGGADNNYNANDSLSSSDGGGIKERICAIEEENLRLHEILVAKSTELWDLLERLRVLGESVRDGSCVGAHLTGKIISGTGTTTILSTNYDAVAATTTIPSMTALSTVALPTAQSPHSVDADEAEALFDEDEEGEEEEEEILVMFDRDNDDDVAEPADATVEPSLHDRIGYRVRQRRSTSSLSFPSMTACHMRASSSYGSSGCGGSGDGITVRHRPPPLSLHHHRSSQFRQASVAAMPLNAEEDALSFSRRRKESAGSMARSWSAAIVSALWPALMRKTGSEEGGGVGASPPTATRTAPQSEVHRQASTSHHRPNHRHRLGGSSMRHKAGENATAAIRRDVSLPYFRPTSGYGSTERGRSKTPIATDRKPVAGNDVFCRDDTFAEEDEPPSTSESATAGTSTATAELLLRRSGNSGSSMNVYALLENSSSSSEAEE